MRILSMRTILVSVVPVLIVLWASPGALTLSAAEKEKEKEPAAEKKAKTEEAKGKVEEAKKAEKAESPKSAAKESTGKALEKAADQGKAIGKAASEAEGKGKGKGKENSLAQETAKHLKRMAQINRLEKIAKDKKSETAQKKIAMLREKELKRHEQALARIGGEKGGKAIDPAKKKADEGKKTGKGA